MPIYCGVDFHARQQVVAWCDTSDGEIRITKLDHTEIGKVREFYAALSSKVIVGLEASGYSQWFEDLLFELKHEVRIGNAAEIRKRARSRQKNDRRDAENILDLLLKNEFPQIYRPDAESRAVLQKLRHRHRLVQLRTKAINHLHAIAINAGLSIKSKLMTREGRKRLQALLLGSDPSAATRRMARTGGSPDAAHRGPRTGVEAVGGTKPARRPVDDSSGDRASDRPGLGSHLGTGRTICHGA